MGITNKQNVITGTYPKQSQTNITIGIYEGQYSTGAPLDITIQLQDAIDSLSNSGGVINILPGSYTLSGDIIISKDNVTIRGQGNSTIIDTGIYNIIIGDEDIKSGIYKNSISNSKVVDLRLVTNNGSAILKLGTNDAYEKVSVNILKAKHFWKADTLVSPLLDTGTDGTATLDLVAGTGVLINTINPRRPVGVQSVNEAIGNIGAKSNLTFNAADVDPLTSDWSISHWQKSNAPFSGDDSLFYILDSAPNTALELFFFSGLKQWVLTSNAVVVGNYIDPIFTAEWETNANPIFISITYAKPTGVGPNGAFGKYNLYLGTSSAFALVNAINNFSSPYTFPAGFSNITFGSDIYSSGAAKGSIADMAFYDKELTLAEVTANYSAGSSIATNTRIQDNMLDENAVGGIDATLENETGTYSNGNFINTTTVNL